VIVSEWTREVDRIALAVRQGGLRVVGVTSPDHKSGVSALAFSLAMTIALSGTSTLIVDLTAGPDDDAKDIIWRPGLGGAGQAIMRRADGIDVLRARFDGNTRFLFNNVEQLRRAFDDDLKQYQAIVIDLPPVCAGEATHISGVAAAAACDGVILVCVGGRIRREALTMGTVSLQSAGAKICGTVVNDVECPTLGAEFAREARRLRRFSPRISSWLERKALASNFLN
jgi:Mrp family chromosome partitioning ATPase